MLVALLSLLLLAALVAAAVLLVVAQRRARRLHAAERAVVELAKAWSEDGTSRGRVCGAAKAIGGAEGAFIAEPNRRGDEVVVTAAHGVEELEGASFPADPDRSLIARTLLLGTALDATHLEEHPNLTSHPAAAKRGIRSVHLAPIRKGKHVVGVLGLGWRDAEGAIGAMRAELVEALAAEAGQAIERDHHQALLERQARTDELTALPNRRAWDEALIREIARADRTGEPLCLALLDLDHFKAFNDTYGHPAGDAHLRRTAAAWRRELRTMDVLARYGGEEFGVLLPSCDLELAREVIDRVRAATPGGETASAGVVLYTEDDMEPQELLDRADRALYQAKRAGRATTVAGDPSRT
ncbi:MAG TPA: sensor domain-containing diguanylate cyclase [Solirubrobacteraceae bacterium]|nr:sensor domain-containing diguanylate cyclase [Solirubrobacteraceae bacterium]